MYLQDELLFDDDLLLCQNEWIKSVQIVDNSVYNVYQGIGDNSFIKVLIKEEIVIDL